MSLVELTKMIVESLVSDPESISVKEFPSDEEIVIEVMVRESDMGIVIGREGKIANAIKKVVQASSYLKKKKKVRININSF